MQITQLALYVSLTLCAGNLAGQPIDHKDVSDSCFAFNQNILQQVAAGQSAEAESALSRALASAENGLGESCTWTLLHNMADLLERNGRLAEAEVFAEQCIKALAKIYAPDHPVLLRPLQLLAVLRLEQGKIARAREAYKRMASIRIDERSEDRSFVYLTGATLLKAEGRYDEAEVEYRKALAILSEPATGDAAAAGRVLNLIGILYALQGRTAEASKIMERADVISVTERATSPMDRIRLLNSRGMLYVRQHQWRKAEEDLRAALSTADRETRLDSTELETLLGNFAFVLRKNHKGREGKAIEARAAALHRRGSTSAVVDVTELSAQPKTFGAHRN